MLTIKDVTSPSEEEKLINKHEYEELLLKYDTKIERILHILLNNLERQVFTLRIPGKASYRQISCQLGQSEAKVQRTMKRVERRFATFRKVLAMPDEKLIPFVRDFLKGL